MSNRKNNLAAVLAPTQREKAADPLANPRLTRKAVQPLGAFVLVELDTLKKKTSGGLYLPDGSVSNVFSDAGPQAAKAFRLDCTATIIGLGPDVEGFELGDRFLLPFPPIPVPVVDSKDGEPLGLLDSRDIVCKVAS